MRTIDSIRQELKGFVTPQCPSCIRDSEPILDDDGYHCERCGDKIPTSVRFDKIVTELQAIKQIENEYQLEQAQYSARLAQGHADRRRRERELEVIIKRCEENIKRYDETLLSLPISVLKRI
jgi:DNA-directed RNA polymerase subunit RPC12/RpoP